MKSTSISAAIATLFLSMGLASPALAQQQSPQQASAQAAQQAGQTGGSHSVDQVKQVISDWKEQPRKVAMDMMNKYGAPQEVTEQRLIWHNNGPWKRSELINEEIDHDFPLPHKDMLLQVVEYQVPADKFDELAAYDGSVIVDRTRGEMGARCDKEAANILALNLAHEVINGKRSVQEARKVYGEQIVAMASGEPAPLMASLQFQPQQNAGFEDKTILSESTVQKVKEQMTSGN
jgi:hypothetical protein